MRCINFSVNILLILLLHACGSVRAPSAGGDAERPVPATPANPARQLAAETIHKQAVELMRRGKADSAIGLLEQMTENYREFAGPYTNLGILYVQKQRLEDAEKILQKAVNINPRAPEAYNQLGIVFRMTGRFDEARKSYETALRLEPNYAIAHLNLGILLDLYLGQLGPALSHYERYQELTPQKDKVVANWIVDLKRRSQKPGEKSDKVSQNP